MYNTLNTDICIIGGGASGLMASIAAASYIKKNGKNPKVIILEKENRVGKKILVTGNGKCNLSNTNMDISFYHGNSPQLVNSLLKKFSTKFIVDLFQNMGLILKNDNYGRIYPYSEQSSSVLDILREEIERLNIRELCNININSISKKSNLFIIKTQDITINTKKLIVATGGCSSSAVNNKTIYSYLKQFGHTLTAIFPALVQIKVKSDLIKSLKGIRCTAKVSVKADGYTLKEEIGELQFIENGLSGICIFQISRLISEFFLKGKIDNIKYQKLSIIVDLAPYLSIDNIKSIIEKRIKIKNNLTLQNFFTGFLNKNLGQALLKSIDVLPLSRNVSTLSKKEISKIVYQIKNWTFIPVGTMPFKNAQVTAGGINANEFFTHSLESKKEPGLFACGEVLDIDGDCGGYNLHWAWSSGYLAGMSCAKQIIKETKYD